MVNLNQSLQIERHPRVHINYQINTGSTIENKELPFILGVLSDLSGNAYSNLTRIEERMFIETDINTFNNLFKIIRPCLKFQVDNKLSNDNTKLEINLNFECIEDFHPNRIVKQIVLFKNILKFKSIIKKAWMKLYENKKTGMTESSFETKADISSGIQLDNMFKQLKSNSEFTDAINTIFKYLKIDDNDNYHNQFSKKIITKLIEESKKEVKNLRKFLNHLISKIDVLVSDQIIEILNRTEFQKLEASWRGLHYLISQSNTGELLKIFILNISKKELQKDLLKSRKIEKSEIYKIIFKDNFNAFDSYPISVLLGDFEIGVERNDVLLLRKMSHIAAEAHLPFIAATKPNFFKINNFSQLNKVYQLSRIFEKKEFDNWKSFRDSENSRYIGLVLPHILLRTTYSKIECTAESFNFSSNNSKQKKLWGNAIYALGSRLTYAYDSFSWYTAICGKGGGGLVTDLPTYKPDTNIDEAQPEYITDTVITDRQEKELADLGFIPLVQCLGTDQAVFFSTQSTNKPKRFDSDVANANAMLSSRLQYTFATTRFVHYFKMLISINSGLFTSKQSCEDFLRNWVAKYVLSDDNASLKAKASRPLREAIINIVEIPEKPGAYKLVAFLNPHFQIEAINISTRVIFNISSDIRF